MTTIKKQSVLTTPTSQVTTTLTDNSPVLPLPNTPQGMLAVGPRVTFHFVQDYNQANSYDYYDVVNVDGTSYIAIKAVPANTPVTDTDYWVKWNDPNAQFSLLLETVQTFDQRITSNANNIQNVASNLDNSLRDKMVVFGDSFSVTSRSKKKWWEYFSEATALEAYSYATSGAGFTATGVGGKTFIDQIAVARNEDINFEQVKYVFLLGGVNDVKANIEVATLQSLIDSFMVQVRSLYPNATIIAIGCNTGLSWEIKDNINPLNYSFNLARRGIYSAVQYTYIDMLTLFVANTSMVESDKLHPTERGQILLCEYIMDSMFGTGYDSFIKSTQSENAESNGETLTISYSNDYIDFSITPKTAGVKKFQLPYNVIPRNNIPFLMYGNENFAVATLYLDSNNVQFKTTELQNGVKYNGRIFIK
jgi:hypothetical protein